MSWGMDPDPVPVPSLVLLLKGQHMAHHCQVMKKS